MDDMDAVYRAHAQTVYKFLLAQCHDPDSAEEGVLEQEGGCPFCGRSTSCRSCSGRWSTSGPLEISASGRLGMCWERRRTGPE